MKKVNNTIMIEQSKSNLSKHNFSCIKYEIEVNRYFENKKMNDMVKDGDVLSLKKPEGKGKL